jgi:predicted  nucleic acid-binding Zn-ribbon protein
MTHPILDLQAADTLADQLRHRRGHLPEQEQVDRAHGALTDWERRRGGLQHRIDELESAIGRSEAESHALDEQKAKLERQLKTVIAPREAEALMHEIALLDEHRGTLDDAELESLEEQSQLADQINAMASDEPGLRADAAAADELAADATAKIDAELADIAGRLDGLRAAVDPALLRRYDGLRGHQVVAVAPLNRNRCDGCYLDLSASEMDDVRDAAGSSGGIAECPHCGRMLVV